MVTLRQRRSSQSLLPQLGKRDRSVSSLTLVETHFATNGRYACGRHQRFSSVEGNSCVCVVHSIAKADKVHDAIISSRKSNIFFTDDPHRFAQVKDQHGAWVIVSTVQNHATARARAPARSTDPQPHCQFGVGKLLARICRLKVGQVR